MRDEKIILNYEWSIRVIYDKLWVIKEWLWIMGDE